METDVKTYRGRTLEALLPQIRSELGPDAIVLRRREGLAGGVGGFFQKQFVEVDARKALPDEQPLEERNDRATQEGLSTPGVQALVAQASPFADTLARAQSTVEERAHAVLVDAASTTEFSYEPVAAGLYGPQPRVAEPEAPVEPSASAPEPAPAASAAPAPPAPTTLAASPTPAALAPPALAAPAAPTPTASAAVAAPAAPTPPLTAAPAPEATRMASAAPPAVPEAPTAAAAVEKRLVDGGLTAGLAADVVGEAVVHGLPFAQPRALKKLVRGAIVRRLPVMADLGPDPRVVAFVGAGGSGKSTAIAHLASVYAAAGASVAVVALGAPDGGRALSSKLEPLGVTVLPAGDEVGATARRLAGASPLLTLIDTPAASPADAGGVAALAAQLRTLGAGEVHLALPATLSAQAAEELAAALRPLGLTHVALTRADETARPGAVVELAIALRRPLSYRCAYDGATPLDPASLAQTLLP